MFVSSTYIIPVKSRVVNTYSLISMDIAIPYPFILICEPMLLNSKSLSLSTYDKLSSIVNMVCDSSSLVDL
jgi:hypothetical protein